MAFLKAMGEQVETVGDRHIVTDPGYSRLPARQGAPLHACALCASALSDQQTDAASDPDTGQSA